MYTHSVYTHNDILAGGVVQTISKVGIKISC